LTTKYDFLTIVDSNAFLGRRKEIADFSNLLRGFQAEKGPNGTIVVGAPGMGKSSLLRILKQTAESDRLEAIDYTIGYQKEASQTLSNIYSTIIEPQLTIKKIKTYRKKMAKIPPITAETEHKDAVDAFLHNLTLGELNNAIVVFIDNVDRAHLSGYSNVIVALVDLMSVFTQRNIPIFLVLSMLDSTWESLKPHIGHMNHFVLDLLDFSTSELMLRKKARNSLQDPEFRKQILGEIDRSPFGLNFAIDMIHWYEEQLEDKNQLALDTVRETVVPILREKKFDKIIEKMLGLSSLDKKIVQVIIGQPSNLITLQDLQAACKGTLVELRRLEEIKLIRMDNNFICLSSNALFERMQGQAEIVTSIESDLLLRLIEGDLRSGFKPSSSMLDQLEMIARGKTESGESARSLGVKGKAIYQLAFDRGHLYDACRLAVLSGEFLVASGDNEGSGHFLEDCGKEFSDAGRPHYAKLLYRKAMENHSSDWRIKTSAREAARIYVDLAEESLLRKRTSITRAFLYEAATLYRIADETDRMRTVITKARRTYAADEKGADFFEKLQGNEKDPEETELGDV